MSSVSDRTNELANNIQEFQTLSLQLSNHKKTFVSLAFPY